MIAMRVLRENAGSMDMKKMHELAVFATDDRGFADQLWEKIAAEKLTSNLGT